MGTRNRAFLNDGETHDGSRREIEEIATISTQTHTDGAQLSRMVTKKKTFIKKI